MNTDLPSTTVRVLLFATLLGVGLLSVFDPAIAVGALSGWLLVAATRLSTGSTGRVIVAGVLLPIAGAGTVVATWLVAGSIHGGVLAVGGLVVGLETALLAGDSDATDRELMRISLLYSTAICLGAAVLVLFAVDIGGIPSVYVRDGPPGLLPATILAAGALVLGAVALPPAMYMPAGVTENQTKYTSGATETRTARRIGIAIVLCSPLIAGLLLLVFLPLADSVVPLTRADLVTSRLARELLAGFTVLGVGIVYVGVLARTAWNIHTDSRELHQNPAVGVMVGSILGVAGISAGHGAADVDVAVYTLLLAAVALLGSGFLVVTWLKSADSLPLPDPTTGIALSLGGGAVVAAELLGNDVAAVTGIRGVVVLAAIAVALFVFSTGRFGFRLVRDVGTNAASRGVETNADAGDAGMDADSRVVGANADSRLQFVAAGWHGSLAVAGFVVAAIGFQLGMRLAPAFTVPAGMGVLAGVVSLLLVAWLLVR